jgi:hypothetical protein
MAKESLSLERLLNTPDLERIVPRLQPQVLHRVVQHFGLEQCGEFVALASPAQIMCVLDADLWRRRGTDAQLDVDRFGLWLTILMQSGVAVAAGKLKGLDIDLVTSALTGHIAVFDGAAVSSYTTLDGESVPGRVSDGSRMTEIGGFQVETKDSSAWDVIVDLLVFLDDQQPAYFHRLMRGCVRLSNGASEPDGFHNLLADEDQQLYDVGQARDQRREALGYVTAAQADAFLQDALNLRLVAPTPPRSSLASAYFREVRRDTVAANAQSPRPPLPSPSNTLDDSRATDAAVAAVVDMLLDAGVLGSEPQRLLSAGEARRLELVQAHVAAHFSAAEELAYLANVLLAGCRIQGREFSPAEASAAVASTCNLGLEHWPRHWRAVDLVTAFQIGWQVLRRYVCLPTAQRLIDTLRNLRVRDRDVGVQLTDLRARLARAIAHDTPWQVRDRLEVLLLLDAPAWAGVLALLDECPVINIAVRGPGTGHTITLGEFEFMSTRRDIAIAERFLERLPTMLKS